MNVLKGQKNSSASIFLLRGEVLRNTSANGIQVTNALIIHSLDISNTNTDYHVAMAQSVEHATASLNVGLSLGHSLLFDQNLRAIASCERIGKVGRSLLYKTCLRTFDSHCVLAVSKTMPESLLVWDSRVLPLQLNPLI